MGDEFQRLLQKASEMKTHQLHKLNKEWYSCPEFLKTTWKHFKSDKHHESSFEERKKTCSQFKAKGNSLFKEKNFNEALEAYSEALSPFVYFSTNEDDDKDDRMPLNDITVTKSPPDQQEAVRLMVSQIFFNCGLSCQKQRQLHDAIYSFRKCLLFCDESNIKAFYQSAVCNRRLGTTISLENAKKSLDCAMKLDSENIQIKALIKAVKQEIREQHVKDQANFGGFFSKGGGIYEDKSEVGPKNSEPRNLEDLLNIPPPPEQPWWVSRTPWVIKEAILNPYSRFVLVIVCSLAFSRLCVYISRLTLA